VPEEFPVEREDIRVIRLGKPATQMNENSTIVEGVTFNFVAQHQAANAAAALAAC
jgi:hypothetical protein